MILGAVAVASFTTFSFADEALLHGASTIAAEIVVSLERVNRIEEINVKDGVMFVQAGVMLRAVQEAAEAHGLHFAGSSLFEPKGELNTDKVL